MSTAASTGELDEDTSVHPTPAAQHWRFVLRFLEFTPPTATMGRGLSNDLFKLIRADVWLVWGDRWAPAETRVDLVFGPSVHLVCELILRKTTLIRLDGFGGGADGQPVQAMVGINSNDKKDCLCAERKWAPNIQIRC